MGLTSALGLLIPIVALVAVFTFVSVAVWSENRRKEREAYYHNETLKKVLEQPGETGQRVLDEFRRAETRQDKLRRDGQRLGGLITFVVGAGLMIFLWAVVPNEPVYLVGIIPALVGAVLVVYSFMVRTETVE